MGQGWGGQGELCVLDGVFRAVVDLASKKVVWGRGGVVWGA